jgi:hypothetical protein
VAVAVAVGVGVAVAVGVGVAVAVAVAVAVGVGVAVASLTTIVPFIRKFRPEWKTYVPGVSKVHVPAQPGPCWYHGSGGVVPQSSPAVCLQLVGCSVSKTMLWRLSPVG